MQNNETNWSGVYNVKAIYKYKQDVEAFITMELVQKNKEITGNCVLKKQSIWKEDMNGVLEGKLEDVTSKKTKLNLKWYNFNKVFQNQSDLQITISNDCTTFEGVIKNMMYTGMYYGTKHIKEPEIITPTTTSEDKDAKVDQSQVRKPGEKRSFSNKALSETNPERRCSKPTELNETYAERRCSKPTFLNEAYPVIDKVLNIINDTKKDKQVKETKEETSVDVKICIICCDKPKQSVFVPCGHKCCCFECAEKFINKHKCPFCKKSVESIIEKVYD